MLRAPKSSLSEVVWNRGRRIGEEKLRMLSVDISAPRSSLSEV